MKLKSMVRPVGTGRHKSRKSGYYKCKNSGVAAITEHRKETEQRGRRWRPEGRRYDRKKNRSEDRPARETKIVMMRLT